MNEKIQGISSSQATLLLERFGYNSVEKVNQFSSAKLLIFQYSNVLNLILLCAAVLAFFISHIFDAFFILMAIFMNGIFSFFQEYRAQKTLEKLKQLSAPIGHVIRDGKEVEVVAQEIVPSDILMLREGDKVSADGVLITSVPIEVDEAILTGESFSVEKKKGDKIYSGTFIVRGRGKIEVSETGLKTKIGQIANELTSLKKPVIPLAQNLSTLGKRLAVLALICSAILIPIGILQGRNLQEMIVVAISIAVAAIPEGLPLVVTIALAVGAYRMVKRKTIVRKISAIETLGATSVILSDKTGTITENKMIVKKHAIFKNRDDFFIKSLVLGNSANIVLEEDGIGKNVVGDGTDGALLLFAQTIQKDIDSLKKEGEVIKEYPFDPITKVIKVSFKEKESTYTFLRGAPESVIEILEPEDKKLAKEEFSTFSKGGLRVIACAYKNGEQKNFSLAGFVALYDPPRQEALRAIREASSAGIRIVMMTGDSDITAKHIAEEIGLISDGELIVTSSEISGISDEKLIEMLPRIRVFARMVPQQKLRLVRLYKEAGYVVAVTGDGVNDALALAEAHIGIAMGGKGTDVAKEAADIVITDDNLLTIVKAVEEGRGIFDNILKVVIFLLATNITEFLFIFLSIVLFLPIPLSPTQILWINLIGDAAPALALATDTKRPNLLKRKPRSITEQILNGKRIITIGIVSLIFSFALFLLYVIFLNSSVRLAQMVVFNALVLGELIVVFVVRGGVFPLNKFLFISIVITLVLQIIASGLFFR